ncbi:hypothetical protein T492DRAFT_1039042 [Pavlovales sp. CCMP2436]|nr:hypothetical protein T492DRAFT_1039042 [Pavlovales sp. CCMP2436]
MACSSSRKRSEGANSLALAKTCAMAASEPPTSPRTSSGICTLMKLRRDSHAIACASSVLPVPGGP